MPLATRNNAIIVKDGKVAENCNCCAGWWCCPEVMHATLSVNFNDYETVVVSGGVFPNSAGYSYCRINASQLNNVPSAGYVLTRWSSDCLLYGYSNSSPLASGNQASWVREITVNASSGKCGIQIVLPAQHTQLARSLSAFNCSDDALGAYDSNVLKKDYEDGRLYGNVAFNTTTYTYITTVNTNNNVYGPYSPTSTSRYGYDVSSLSIGPPSWSWQVQFIDKDPASCAYFGAPQNSAIYFPSTKPVGTASVTAAIGCP